MDKIYAFIKEEKKCHKKESLDDLIQWYSEWAGFPWLTEDLPEQELRIVEAPELEMRSALEFIRPELSPSQIKFLDSWDKRFNEAVKKGIFYSLYAAASGYRFTWEDARKEASEMLGRTIPRSHWWFWPPEK